MNSAYGPKSNQALHPCPRSPDPCGKGLGWHEASADNDVGGFNWNILDEDVSLPAAVLRASRIEHNLNWMREFVQRYDVKLAPHGKTTMSPALFRRQVDAGAWGITLATASQTQAAYRHGIRRVLMANQLVGRANIAIVARLLRDTEFEFCCLVDSVDNVAALGAAFAEHGVRLRVLLEIGVQGGRTGVRNNAQAQAVVEEIARWPQSLALIGVEVYEGVLKTEDGIRALLRRTIGQLRAIEAEGRFAEPKVLLSGAGSAWFDVVAEEFAISGLDRQRVEMLLRPGCYLTHDVGIYRDAEQRIHASNPVAREMGRSLLPALQVWAYVQSIPESGLAVVGLGKRDAAFDAGFPLPALHYRPGTAAPRPAPEHWRITGMMDQHAYLRHEDGDGLRVGDLLCFDISHPCLTFDRWRQLLVVDESHRVIDLVDTYF